MGIYSYSGKPLQRLAAVSASAVRRGNLALLATAEFHNGQMVNSISSKQRFVWPNPYKQSASNVMSRKVYAKGY